MSIVSIEVLKILHIKCSREPFQGFSIFSLSILLTLGLYHPVQSNNSNQFPDTSYQVVIICRCQFAWQDLDIKTFIKTLKIDFVILFCLWHIS